MARPYARVLTSCVTAVAFTAMQLPLTAFAQNSAQAEVLFKEGQQLMGAQKYEEACKRLTASYKLDPQPNTELVQGVCFSKLGKTASAYNAFLDASSTLPKGGDAQKYAEAQAKALESQLLKVKVEIQPSVPPDVQIKFDDEKTRDKDFVDVDIALDPGDHDLSVTASGKHDYTKHFTLKPGEPSPHTIDVSMTDKTKEELAAEQNKGGGGQVIVEKQETSWSTTKTVGLIGMIVGATTLVVGGVFGILTLVDVSNFTNLQRGDPACVDLNNPPPGDATCQDAHNYHSEALTAQTVGIILAVAGGVIGITGIVLFVVGGNTTKAAEKTPAASLRLVPMLSAHSAGLGLSGTF